jgi:hypothetical protein
MVGYAIKETERTTSTSVVIINSFADLEDQVVDAMETLLGLPKVDMLGLLPLVATPHSTAIVSGLTLWKEQEEFLQWLHDKDPDVVVYVNFGSIVVMTNEHLVEFAWGLANSGGEFIWIIRCDLVKGDAAVIPLEFLVTTPERGFMASWCLVAGSAEPPGGRRVLDA